MVTSSKKRWIQTHYIWHWISSIIITILSNTSLNSCSMEKNVRNSSTVTGVTHPSCLTITPTILVMVAISNITNVIYAKTCFSIKKCTRIIWLKKLLDGHAIVVKRISFVAMIVMTNTLKRIVYHQINWK